MRATSTVALALLLASVVPIAGRGQAPAVPGSPEIAPLADIATTPAVMRVRWANGAPVGEPERFVELPTSAPAVHTSRTIGFGKDGRLYVTIGSSCDVCVEGDPRRTTIQVYNANGSSAGAFATGLRNANGFDFDPATGPSPARRAFPGRKNCGRRAILVL